MPYSKISELPDQVKVLPEDAQQQFLRVVNSSLKRGDDEDTAFAKAWGVIKRGYEKNDQGEWVAKMTDEPELLVELGEGEGGWRLYLPFKTIHHGIRKDFTINDGIEMVSNFKQHVPDYDLPINSLHRDEFGVYGIIDNLRVSDRGVEWLPKFYDGAVEELTKKGYKYASPEVQFDGYTGVFDGKEYKNVALGIAITPRPRLGRDTLVFSDGEWQEYNEESEAGDQVQEMHRFAFEFPQFKKWAEEKIARIESIFSESERDKAREAQEARASKYGIAIRDDGHITKPSEWENVPDSEFCDPVNYLYPCPDDKQTRAALSYFGQHKDKYDSKSRGVVEARLNSFKKKFGIGANDEKEQAAMDEQEKLNNAQADEARLQEKDAQITALEEEKARLQEEQEQLKVKLAEFEAVKAEAERIALEEKTARRKLEFAEIAKQFSTVPEDNFGDELMWLNDADGTERKVHYEKLLNVLKALTNQKKTAALFSEVGHEGTAAKTAEERFEAKVKEAMQDGLRRADAIAKVAKENGALYAEYDRVVTKTVNE